MRPDAPAWHRESDDSPPKALGLRELELAMIRASDETWVVTATRRARVAADVPGTELRVVPIFHEIEVTCPRPRAGRAIAVRRRLRAHAEHRRGAVRLVREVMPLVWASSEMSA